ncbi:hypothetical protein COLO4_34818 [Corchorus olitorius]|uniref:Uncharacterized protein n=1 Tax=Corchorus olitorius TaxID=93759 RepID=A0A1R3GJ95_9ROSI|nr:hypothetical protein COLO4_34818 [Corchorus olitorius]
MGTLRYHMFDPCPFGALKAILGRTGTHAIVTLLSPISPKLSLIPYRVNIKK